MATLNKLVARKVKRDKVLPSVHPNAGFEAWYRAALQKRIEEMHASVMYWVMAKFKVNEPRIAAAIASDGKLALDASPAQEMKKIVDELTKRWKSKFDKGATELAKYFAKSAGKRTDLQLRKILKDAGFSVEFQTTKLQRDILHAVTNENVSLIKSIPSEYLQKVEGSVMRSIQKGHDIGGLADELQKHYGVTKKRARFIARDQTTKTVSAMNRARQVELGIETAVWKHSHAGKQPRPTHLANDGNEYNVKEGWYDPAVGEYIFPGELPNCRCTSRSVIPAFKGL